ncbi:MAG: hypothetical protein M1814_002854 [Vezdaea aestivalis]|nr:MAG: hypothetical protein M1814_002854 [Vezdaea aestivalis]
MSAPSSHPSPNESHGPDAASTVCPADSETVAPGRPTTQDKQSFNYILRTGLAGGLAGCAAKTVVGPLDRVKILFQASSPSFLKYSGHPFGMFRAMSDIFNETGTRGLFKGHSATLLRIFPYAAIKFLAYEQIRAVLIDSPSKETAGRRFLVGAMAGVTSVAFTYPLEVVRVRLAFETRRGASRGAFGRIVRQVAGEGNSGAVANFYRGFAPTLLGMLPYAGMSFLTHDVAGDVLRQQKLASWTTLPGTAKEDKPPKLRAPFELLAGGVAGLVSQTTAYPLEVIRRRMQVGGAVGDGHRLKIGEVARRIWTERGIRGFFVGLFIGYVKVVPMVATSFFVYERSKSALGI